MWKPVVKQDYFYDHTSPDQCRRHRYRFATGHKSIAAINMYLLSTQRDITITYYHYSSAGTGSRFFVFYNGIKTTSDAKKNNNI